MTATQLAARAGVSKSFISQVENGRTSASLDTLARLAAALGVPASALLVPSRGDFAQPGDSDQVRVLYATRHRPAAFGTKRLSSAALSAHGVVTIPPGGTATGTIDAGSSALIVGLRGGHLVLVASSHLTIEVGDVVSLVAPGEYRLLNEGAGVAVVLVSAGSEADLPQVLSAPVVAASRTYDPSGPLRLVTMRARRRAESER